MTEKEKALKEAMNEIRKKHGDASILEMNDEMDFKVEAIPTGCFALDEAIGCGGLPRGRIIELFGQESSGKSTLSMFFMAQVQRAGGKAALIDAEFAFSGDYAKSVGVDVNDLVVSQPGTLEEAVDVIDALVRSHAVDLIVVDSVASLVPRSELESDELLKDSMAVQARLMGKALRILTGSISQSKTVVIFINQVREKVGVFYGKKETTPGGKALKFFSSVRIEVAKGEKISGKDGEQIGNWVKATCVKNKVGMPFRKAEFELYYEKGVDLVGAALDYGTDKGIVHKLGNTYSYKDEKLGTSRDAAKKALGEKTELYEALVKEIVDNP